MPMHQDPLLVIKVVADVLLANRHQAISDHHIDLAVIKNITWLSFCITYYITVELPMLERCMFHSLLIHLSLTGSSHSDNGLCRTPFSFYSHTPVWPQRNSQHLITRPWFNIKMWSYQYRNSIHKDVMVSWPFHLYDKNPYTKMVSLFFLINPLGLYAVKAPGQWFICIEGQQWGEDYQDNYNATALQLSFWNHLMFLSSIGIEPWSVK